ncbi:MAG: hypothetical protein D6767_10310 [Candidatus Hydrogenedentota bacterium]|nr:MAG: hypothetical protein D6767_10310 [Candidatus Hydrogenedentota bacterium]
MMILAGKKTFFMKIATAYKVVVFLLGFVLLYSPIYAASSLAYPKLSKELSGNKLQYETGEHWMVNLLVGAFSGAALGTLTGLSMYNSSDMTATNQNLVIFAGGGGLAGGILGGVFTWIEIGRGEQFTIGKEFMDYSWYGGIGGGVLGAMAGLIPYASSKNTDDILKFTGYGAGIGIAISWMLFLWNPFEKSSESLQFLREGSSRYGRLSIFLADDFGRPAVKGLWQIAF